MIKLNIAEAGELFDMEAKSRGSAEISVTL